MAQNKEAKFSPYHTIKQFGGEATQSGINWSYAVFPSKKQVEEFEKACNDNGYRTRNLGKTVESSGPDSWYIQYHHYED